MSLFEIGCIQQLSNSSRLCGMWGNPDVHNLTPMSKKEIVFNRSTENSFLKNKAF